MRVYRYLYYNLFSIWLKKKDEYENARINAVITITFLIYVNAFSIPLVFLAISKNEIVNLPENNLSTLIWIAVFLLFVGVLNYFSLARKECHNRIIDEFKAESQVKRKKGLILTTLYLIISFSIPLIIFFFTTPK